MLKNDIIHFRRTLNVVNKKRGGRDMEKILKILKKFWGKKSYAEIAAMTGQTADAVRKMGRHYGLPAVKLNKQNSKLTPQQEIERDVVLGNLHKETKQTKKKYEVVADENQTLKAVIEAFKVVKDLNSFSIKRGNSGAKNEATAVAVLSDIHFEETVHPENVNGENEYNPQIAKERLEKFFVNVVKLINDRKQKSEIRTLVLALLGDLINGQLREEAMENNSLLPMDALLAVGEVISSGIRYILANTDVKMMIPCHIGNHSRITKKVHVATEAGNSLEYVLYHSLAREFKGESRVEFFISRSYHSFLDVCGYKIRFHHGHAMKYNGGVGGIYASVNKAIAQWNKIRQVDLDVFGHYHQFRDGGNFICNGSVIGFNEFANWIKADFEKPKQAFFLIDHARREKSVTCPVFLD